MNSNGNIKRFFSSLKPTNEPPQKKFLVERIQQEVNILQKNKKVKKLPKVTKVKNVQSIQKLNSVQEKDLNQCDGDKNSVNCEKCSQKEKEIIELKNKLKISEENLKISGESLKISEKKIHELLKDNKYLKHVLSQSNRVNLNKDIKIEILEKEFEKKTENNSAKFDNKFVFSSFSNIFNDQELASLRSIPASSSRDSSFILFALRALYKGDLSVLNSRTVSNALPDKQPITPQKKQIIKNIFYERLETLKLDTIECNLRKSKLNELTATGIKNIRKSLKNRHSL